MLGGVSLSATGTPLGVRIGSGSFEATGYVGGYGTTTSTGGADAVSSTVFFMFAAFTAATDTMTGSIIITNVSGNLWVAQGLVWRESATTDVMFTVAGSKTTSGVLDRLRITTGTAVPTFDAGTINILYE